MKNSVLLAVAVVLAVGGGLGAIKVFQFRTLIESGKNYKEPPETVSSAIATEEKWQQSIVAVGTITPVQGVNIAAEVPGMVVEIAFQSGAMVAKGDLLVRLDTSSEEAQLRALEAQTELAQLNANRIRELRAQTAVSQSELDTATLTLKQFQANADAVRATIAKKTIRAPFAGRLGIRQINLGEYVEAGRTTIVSLQALEKVYAEFSLPQQEVSRIAEGMKVRLVTDAYPGRDFTGTLSSLNPDLDVSTRSLRVQAAFDNAGDLLRPGMFGRVEVVLPQEQRVVVIPATAVFSAPYGDLVYVIQSSTNSPEELVVQQQLVRTGAKRGDFISVETGLKPGERVVRSGMFKLRNGGTVIINDDLVPESDHSPRPANS